MITDLLISAGKLINLVLCLVGTPRAEVYAPSNWTACKGPCRLSYVRVRAPCPTVARQGECGHCQCWSVRTASLLLNRRASPYGFYYAPGVGTARQQGTPDLDFDGGLFCADGAIRRRQSYAVQAAILQWCHLSRALWVNYDEGEDSEEHHLDRYEFLELNDGSLRDPGGVHLAINSGGNQGCPNRAESRGSASRFAIQSKWAPRRFGDSAIR